MTEQWQELKETIIELRDNDGTGTQQETCKFLANLMDALEKQMQEHCEDCISRQDAIDEFKNGTEWYDFANWCRIDIIEVLEGLPSVTPARKIGRWILTDDDLVYCSECEDSYYPRPIDASWYYCPHCGAKMQEEEDT